MIEVANRAHELGIIVYVTDYLENSPAKKVADKSYNIDAMDVDALYEMAIAEKVDGVLVGVADILVPMYCKVCEALDLPCYATQQNVDVFAFKIYSTSH